jgi:hypothetical protein
MNDTGDTGDLLHRLSLAEYHLGMAATTTTGRINPRKTKIYDSLLSRLLSVTHEV